MQTRFHSALETSANVISGMLIAFLLSQIAAHYEMEIRQYVWSGFEWKVSAGSNMVMTIVLTVVSMCRGYSWRRYFNKRILRGNNETTKN